MSYKQKIKVLHVFEYFEQGGIENFVMNVFRNIDRENIQFDFAFINKNPGVFDEEARDLGGNIYYFDKQEKTFKNYKKSLTKIITKHGPYDVVHSHMYYFSGYILGIAKKCGVKIRIAHSHETLKGRNQTLIRRCYERYMRRLIKKNATVCLSCSNLAGEYVFGKKAKFKTLYNGIDVKRFCFNEERRAFIRKDLNIADDELFILNIGRFADQKNHLFILDIFSEVLKLNANSKLILIGTGALKEKIEHEIKLRNMTDKVIILSNIRNTEDYYSVADVFILPSKYEGMSIVSVEAQASGLNALLSDNVTKEIAVTDLTSYLSINNTQVDWAEKIIELAGVTFNRVEYNDKFADTPFDIQTTVKDLTRIYSQS